MNSAIVPQINLVASRFSDGMSYTNLAAAHVRESTEQLLEIARQHFEGLQPLDLINLLAVPTYEEIESITDSIPLPPIADAFPVMPDISHISPPTNTFDYHEDRYASDIENAIKETLPGQIRAGGVGWGAAAEQAIWDREVEREDQAQQDAIDALADQTSEVGGFSFPDGVMASAIERTVNERAYGRETSSRDIAAKQAELAYQQTKDIITAGTAFEGIEQQYATSMRDRMLTAARAKPEIAVAIFRAEVEHINIYIAQYNAIAQKTNAAAEIFKTQMLGYTAKIDTKTKIVDSSVKKYMAETDGVSKANTSMLQKNELLLKQLIEYFALQTDAVKAITTIYSQIASSALAGMTASASAHASGQNSDSYSYSGSDVEIEGLRNA